MFDWRRVVVFTHRWLGVCGCLLFIAWFASGVVMMYARMPELSREEFLARLPLLDWSAARVDPARAFGADANVLPSLRIGMLGGRPVYRAPIGRELVTVYADDGKRFGGLTMADALEEARRFAPEDAATIRYDARIAEPDQWTLQHSRSLPMHRVKLGDAAGSVIYLSERTGEVIVKTTAAARRVAYAGAVLHWLYFTPFRKDHALWTQAMIWLSLLGTLMCALGLVWGFYNWSRLPFRGWLRWHHYAGLAFGIVSFTWIFSGLLSLDPWDWHADTAPDAIQREAFSGGSLAVSGVSLADIAAQMKPGTREVEIVPFRRRPRVLLDGRASRSLDEGEMGVALKAAMPGADLVDVAWLNEYDSYYYDRTRELPLPIVRARYGDASSTWLYADPNRGAILRKEERSSRLNRWLYHGLHSLDFPFLYGRRPLWDIVMILLIAGGIGSAATAVVPASRRVWRRVHRLL